ncbi:MAG: hypothetical protein ABFS35_22810, partial [Bacteroidota bacterium]
KGNPFGKEHSWGSISISKNKPVVYVHLLNWIGGDVEVKGIGSNVLRASFLDNGEEVEFDCNKKDAEIKLSLPDDNISGKLRIVKLEFDEIAFDMEQGSDYKAQQVKHANHKKIVGTITEITGTNFTFKGKMVSAVNGGKEALKGKEITMELTLNDHVRFRTNFDGDIRQVQGYDLEIDKKYHVVYSPSKKGAKVKIITLLEK